MESSFFFKGVVVGVPPGVAGDLFCTGVDGTFDRAVGLGQSVSLSMLRLYTYHEGQVQLGQSHPNGSVHAVHALALHGWG